MKVAIVDDNIAIQEILKDILMDNGHIVNISGTIEEAVQNIPQFRPDVILLDSVVNEEDGLQVLTRIHEDDPTVCLDTVLVKGLNEEAPKDNIHILAVVNKPFKTADIPNALGIVSARKESLKADAERKTSRNTGFLAKLKRSTKVEKEPEPQHLSVDDTSIVAQYIASDAPLYGRSYVFFEDEPNKIYEFARIFNPDDYSILIISSYNPKVVKQRFGSDLVDVTTLSSTGRSRSMDINALGTLTVFINDYISENDKPIVLIDDCNDIVDSNDLNQALVFLHQLVDRKPGEKLVTFAVSISKNGMNTKDINILLGDFSEYN